ncbi:MAG TPA: tetratricopeptide repeat protein [Longimicrobiales bacterium]|nr:tetratricopeptide repeat protein [Longimicrobiales bacterium]
MKVADWIAELRRRHVIRVAVAYVVVAAVAVQASDVLAPNLGLPDWTTTLVIVIAALGLPIALVLSWLFDVTPSGPTRTDAPDPREPSAVTQSAPDHRRIAILPFSSFSPGQDDEYFASGVTEELTSVISRVSGLEVIARTSVMPYKTAPQPVSVVARDLRVGTVLEGSIRRAGDRVRVTVQLIDTSSEAHLWSEDYDRDLSDIFAIQTDIALAVADALRVRLLEGEEERIEKAPTQDLEAHDLYLLGRHHLLKRNHQSLLRAIDLFERALEKDPSYALAAAGLGESWMWAALGYVMDPPDDVAERARSAAERGVRLDGTLAETHIALALVANFQSDVDVAWSALQRAIELNPSSAPAFQALGLYWIAKGDFAQALRAYERAVELDPRSANMRLEAGWPPAYERRYEEFLERIQEALELDPDYALAHFNLGACLDALGDPRRGIAAHERALELGGLWGLTKGFIVRAHVHLGEEDEARAVLAEIEGRAATESGLCLPLAIGYDALGDAERAVDWLERGIARADEPTAGWLHLEGFMPFEATRDHPRFQAILEAEARRVGRL